MKIRECRIAGIWDIGFIDPDKVHVEMIKDHPEDTEDVLLTFKKTKYQKGNIFSLQLWVSVTVLFTFYFYFPILSVRI